MSIKNSIKSHNIALLSRPRFERGVLCTVVNVGDPRNSLVTSLSNDVTIVLTKEDSMQMINISDAIPEANFDNFKSLSSEWPKQKIFIHQLEKSTVDSIVFDSDDFNERESILCFSNSVACTNQLLTLVSKHNEQYKDNTFSFEAFAHAFSNTLDEISNDISFKGSAEPSIAKELDM
jgi:glycogen synthase